MLSWLWTFRYICQDWEPYRIDQSKSKITLTSTLTITKFTQNWFPLIVFKIQITKTKENYNRKSHFNTFFVFGSLSRTTNNRSHKVHLLAGGREISPVCRDSTCRVNLSRSRGHGRRWGREVAKRRWRKVGPVGRRWGVEQGVVGGGGGRKEGANDRASHELFFRGTRSLIDCFFFPFRNNELVQTARQRLLAFIIFGNKSANRQAWRSISCHPIHFHLVL